MFPISAVFTCQHLLLPNTVGVKLPLPNNCAFAYAKASGWRGRKWRECRKVEEDIKVLKGVVDGILSAAAAGREIDRRLISLSILKHSGGGEANLYECA